METNGEQNIINFITKQYHISGDEQQRIINWYLSLPVSDTQRELNIETVYNQDQLVLLQNDTICII